MVVVVTRNVPDRFRGFLASCMLEIAPGVYTSPKMSRAVRERVWAVLIEWAEALPQDGGVLMTFRDASSLSGQVVLVLGWPKKEIVEHNGVWLERSVTTEKNNSSEQRKV